MTLNKAVFSALIIGLLTLLAFSLSACVAPTSGAGHSTPTVTALHGNQQSTKVTVLPLHVKGTDLTGLIEGPDKSLWFTELVDNNITIAKTTPWGQLTEFAVPNDSFFGSMSAGSDGNIWFGGGTSLSSPKWFVARITPDGQITEFPLPHTGDSPGDMTLGADGNIWFVLYHQALHTPATSLIGRITPTGAITEFPLPRCSSYFPEYPLISGITAGPDGTVWFDLIGSSDCGVFRVDSITRKGAVSVISILDIGSTLGQIARGPRDTVWLLEGDRADSDTINIVCIGCVAGTHIATAFDMPKSRQTVTGLVMGPDGNVWFTGYDFVYSISFVGVITPGGKITTYILPTFIKTDQPVFGSDNALYFIDRGRDQIDRVQIVG